jgi:hypothetical protein
MYDPNHIRLLVAHNAVIVQRDLAECPAFWRVLPDGTAL